MYRLAGAEHVMRNVLDAALRPHGLGLTTWAVLSQIADSPGLSVAEVTRRTFITQQAVSKITAQLEGDGLVSRAERSGNRRIQELTVTSKGLRLSGLCDELIVQLEHDLRKRMGEDRAAAALDAVEHISSFFESFLREDS